MRMSKSSRIARSKEQGVRRFIFLLMLSIMSFLAPHSSLLTEVRADDLHYNNILVGERAAGMGGAYTAISDDPSGLYYNPAGIVFAPGRSFSASVNAFQYSQKKYKDVLGGNGWERKSSNLQPNYFGIIQPLGEGKIGFSYAVPDSRLEDQDQTLYNFPGSAPNPLTDKIENVTVSRYVINLNDTDYTYNFGPSYAMKINDKLSVGTTLYMHYRERELIGNHFVTLDDGRFEWTNSYNSLTEWGVKPIVGLMWEPVEKVTIGLTLSKNYIFDTDRRIQNTYKGIAYRNPSNSDDLVEWGAKIPDYNVFESDDNRKLPLTATAGIAYFPSESLLVSADISYYDKADYTLKFKDKVAGATDSLQVEQERVVNVAVGAEYYPNERIALRGGLFSNMANTPDLSSAKANQSEHIDMYGASLSVSRFTRSSSLTLGGSYSMGSGEAQIVSGSNAIQDVDMQNFTAFISAAFSY